MWPRVKREAYQSQDFPWPLSPVTFSWELIQEGRKRCFRRGGAGVLSITLSIGHHFILTPLLGFAVYVSWKHCLGWLRLLSQWLLYWRKEMLGWMSPLGLVRSHHKFAFQRWGALSWFLQGPVIGAQKQCVSILGEKLTVLPCEIENCKADQVLFSLFICENIIAKHMFQLFQLVLLVY